MGLELLLNLPVEEWRGRLVNDFERTVFAKYPQLADYKRELYEQGALYASMSGSGSSALSGLTDEADSGDGSFLLKDVATVEKTVSLNTINRDQQRRCVTVTAGIADGSKALRAALHSLPRALHGLTGRKTFYLIIAYPAAILYIILNILL